VEFGYQLSFWSRIDENSGTAYETRTGESIFPPSVLRLLKKHYVLDGYPASYVCHSVRSSFLVKMIVERRWSDTDR